MDVNGPLSWPFACLDLEHHNLQVRPLEQINSWIMNLRKRCHRTTVAEAPLPERRSKEACQRRASMLVSHIEVLQISSQLIQLIGMSFLMNETKAEFIC